MTRRMAAHEPWYRFVGDTWRIEFICGDENGVPIDISAGTLTWLLNDDTGNINFKYLSLGDGITLTDGPNGAGLIVLSAAETAILDAGTYKDELTLQIGGTVDTQSFGLIFAMSKLSPTSKYPVRTTLAGASTLFVNGVKV